MEKNLYSITINKQNILTCHEDKFTAKELDNMVNESISKIKKLLKLPMHQLQTQYANYFKILKKYNMSGDMECLNDAIELVLISDYGFTKPEYETSINAVLFNL